MIKNDELTARFLVCLVLVVPSFYGGKCVGENSVHSNRVCRLASYVVQQDVYAPGTQRRLERCQGIVAECGRHLSDCVRRLDWYRTPTRSLFPRYSSCVHVRPKDRDRCESMRVGLHFFNCGQVKRTPWADRAFLVTLSSRQHQVPQMWRCWNKRVVR